MVSTPYSSVYCWPMVVHGSLPFLRIGMKPQPSLSATAPPKMKPRASMPATASILLSGERLRHRRDRRLEAVGVAASAW